LHEYVNALCLLVGRVSKDVGVVLAEHIR
jgi:hypothetical protein